MSVSRLTRKGEFEIVFDQIHYGSRCVDARLASRFFHGRCSNIVTVFFNNGQSLRSGVVDFTLNSFEKASQCALTLLEKTQAKAASIDVESIQAKDGRELEFTFKTKGSKVSFEVVLPYFCPKSSFKSFSPAERVIRVEASQEGRQEPALKKVIELMDARLENGLFFAINKSPKPFPIMLSLATPHILQFADEPAKRIDAEAAPYVCESRLVSHSKRFTTEKLVNVGNSDPCPIKKWTSIPLYPMPLYCLSRWERLALALRQSGEAYKPFAEALFAVKEQIGTLELFSSEAIDKLVETVKPYFEKCKDDSKLKEMFNTAFQPSYSDFPGLSSLGLKSWLIDPEVEKIFKQKLSFTFEDARPFLLDPAESLEKKEESKTNGKS